MQRSLIILLFTFLSIFAVNSLVEELNEVDLDPFEKDKILACGEIVSAKYKLDMVNIFNNIP
jgi:hypothetical protein